MNNADQLSTLLKELACLAPQAPSRETDEQLLAAFRAQKLNRRRRLWTYAAEVAASVALACALYLGVVTNRSAKRSGAPPETDSCDIPGFIALPYSQSDVPIGDAMIVRVKIPEGRVGSKESSEPITADLLIGQDGVPRAVRFIQ